MAAWRGKKLFGKVQHHGAVLADRIEHDWLGKLRRHLTHNMDAFGFSF